MEKRTFHIRLRRCAALLCAVSLAASGVTVRASSTDELQEKSGSLKNEISSMNSELSTLSSRLEEITQDVTEKAEAVDQASDALAQAIRDESEQYESMKERIRFMYEGGNISLIQILLSSEDMGDFLNKAEYVSNISAYDREMLTAFQDARAEVEKQQQTLESEQQELLDLQSDLSAQTSNLEDRIADSSSDLSKYSAKLQAAKDAEALAAQKAAQEEAESSTESQSSSQAKDTKESDTTDSSEASSKKETQKTQTDTETKTSESTSSETTSDSTTSLGSFRITHYCNCKVCCGKWSGGNTASGTTPTAGRTIAVDPSVIPLGSIVVINGKTYIAEDTGKAIKGKRIDIYVNTHSAALSYGTYYADVYVK